MVTDSMAGSIHPGIMDTVMEEALVFLMVDGMILTGVADMALTPMAVQDGI